jgi:uncharacterized membrane protein
MAKKVANSSNNVNTTMATTVANSSNNVNNWTSEPMTLSFFTATHGACKPAQVNTADGVRHSIDAADGASALFSHALEAKLYEAKAAGQKFKLDQSKLVIRAYKNGDKVGYMAYYQNKQESNDFEL